MDEAVIRAQAQTILSVKFALSPANAERYARTFARLIELADEATGGTANLCSTVCLDSPSRTCVPGECRRVPGLVGRRNVAAA